MVDLRQEGLLEVASADRAVSAQLAEGRKATPIKWWAGIGVACLLLFAYLLTAWVVSGDFKTTPVGDDPVPGSMKFFAILVQVLAPAGFIAMAVKFIALPLKRERRIPFDGLLLLGLGTVVWQDPLSLYTQAWGTYNTYFVNFGSWAMHIPGWGAPGVNNLGEPVFFLFAYMTLLLPVAFFCCWLMRRAKDRWPEIGTVGLVGIALAAGWMLDLLLEGAFAYTGLYNFAGVPGPKLFEGTYHAFPLIEAPLMGTYFAAIACLRFFVNDKGESIAERGADKLAIVGRKKTLVRFLAIAGVLNVAFLAAYNLPFQWLDTRLSAWPADIQSRSYFRSEMCGPGTGRHCSAPFVPIPTMNSGHLDARGRYVPAER